ncbi:MAG: membrane protein insertase YidC [Planctomycetota bacterium]|nr:membrane protein insertase YidC [Planctomycetota bacterium]
MPAEKNTTLRVLVPIIVVIIGVGIVVAGYRNTTTQGKSGAASPAALPPASPASGAAGAGSASADRPAGDAVDVQPAAEVASGGVEGSQGTAATPDAAAQSTPATAGLSDAAGSANAGVAPQTPVGEGPAASPARMMLMARPQPEPAEAPAMIGGLAEGGADRLQISFTLLGAGIETISTAEHFETIARNEHYRVQMRMTLPAPGGGNEVLSSLAARAVLIDGQLVDLFGAPGAPVWRERGPGDFEAEIVDQDGAAVLRLRKTYTLRPGGYVFDIEQRAENLTDRAMRLEWVQYGPVELHEDVGGYGLDMRRVRMGFLLEPGRDPSRQFVQPDSKLVGRGTVIDRVVDSGDGVVWPRPRDFKDASSLVWLAQTSRYFAFAVFPRVAPDDAAANAADPAARPLDKSFHLADEVFAIVRGAGDNASRRLLMQMTSEPIEVSGGGTADLSFSAYAGPLGRRQLSEKADPLFVALAMDRMVIYNLGGPCAFCTFQWLAHGLLAFLTVLHDYVVFDWALAIMVLVVCVRTVLHPVTRRSQIGLQRFSKQMQSLAPKQQKLRERYKDDPKRLQEEMIKLMREEKVNYAGALGCLPMFLQSPIWFALYAMLYFSFDLRHEPAFFGVFQTVTGGAWSFLGDLSVADHFIDFGGPVFSIPLFGKISGINVLPIVLGVVFYIQQKYLTPPTTASMSPEQELNMKITRVMIVYLFPLLMYNAPSGLALYFITNSTLGILESRWIRAHIDTLDKRAAVGLAEPLGRRKVENTAKHPGKK